MNDDMLPPRYFTFLNHGTANLLSYLAMSKRKLEKTIEQAQKEIKALDLIAERVAAAQNKCPKCEGTGWEVYEGSFGQAKTTFCGACRNTGDVQQAAGATP